MFTQELDEKSANVCDGLCMCKCRIFMCMQARPRGMPGQWGRGSVHSVPRVGVLGWLRPMVLHNQPAKSTSSTSDRLMNVWLWNKNTGFCTVSTVTSQLITLQSNYQMSENKLKNAHHQHLQIRSLSRVFDQTADTNDTTKGYWHEHGRKHNFRLCYFVHLHRTLLISHPSSFKQHFGRFSPSRGRLVYSVIEIYQISISNFVLLPFSFPFKKKCFISFNLTPNVL